MAIDHYFTKRGDTGEDLIIQCQNGDGSLIEEDLDGATVEFHMMQVNADGTASVLIPDGAGYVVDTGEKLIGYAWTIGDTDVASAEDRPHQAEFEVTLQSGQVITFPNSSNIFVSVYPDIA